MGTLTKRGWLSVAVAVATLAAVPAVAGAQGSRYGAADNFGRYSGPGYTVHQGANGESDVNVCAQNQGPGRAACDARVVTQPAASANATSAPSGAPASNCPANDPNAPPAVISGGNGGYDPCYLQSAYNAASLAEANGGRGQIVAIVDYSVDTSIASDLAAYRSQFGLPSCPSGTVSASSTGCVFQQVIQSGAPTSGTSGWDVEISLDVDTVSAICPNCQILLIEASSASFSGLGSAVNTAVSDGAIAVSNSYGAPDFSGENTYASAYYQHPGVAVTVSSGDQAGVVQFPSSAPDVVAVGGTSLLQYSNTGTRSANATETVWNGTPAPGDGAGAGCSQYESAPSWQSSFITAAGGSSLCSTRVTADVSADADPDTGLWIYDTYSQGGWLIVGGTSLASPLIAALYGLSNNAAGSTSYPSSTLYASSTHFYHVTSGNVGTCGTYLCDATKSINGFNGPSGVGTPGGSGALAAFAFNPSTPPAPPATPTGLAAGTITSGSVALSWTAESSATSYTVYQGLTSTSLSAIATTSAASYTATGLTAGTTYYFAVSASNSGGSSSESTPISATTTSPTAPSAPTGLAASAGNGSVSLTWTAPTNNGGSPITGYTVHYSTTKGGELTGASQAAASTSATVTGLTNGTTYYFEVTATNNYGTSGVSNEASATPANVALTAPGNLQARAVSGSSVSLTWTASTGSGTITYSIYVSTSPSFSTATKVGSVSGTSATVSGLKRFTTYYFWVQASNGTSTATAGPVSSRG